jgi:hypothetical protein
MEVNVHVTMESQSHRADLVSLKLGRTGTFVHFEPILQKSQSHLTDLVSWKSEASAKMFSGRPPSQYHRTDLVSWKVEGIYSDTVSYRALSQSHLTDLVSCKVYCRRFGNATEFLSQSHRTELVSWKSSSSSLSCFLPEKVAIPPY